MRWKWTLAGLSFQLKVVSFQLLNTFTNTGNSAICPKFSIDLQHVYDVCSTWT